MLVGESRGGGAGPNPIQAENALGGTCPGSSEPRVALDGASAAVAVWNRMGLQRVLVESARWSAALAIRRRNVGARRAGQTHLRRDRIFDHVRLSGGPRRPQVDRQPEWLVI